MSNKAICSKASKFHQRAAWQAGLRGPCTNRMLFRALLACFTPAVQAELDDFRKKEKKSDGEAAKFQSRDHQRPARLQAASLGGFPCHSYPTRLHLLPGPCWKEEAEFWESWSGYSSLGGPRTLGSFLGARRSHSQAQTSTEEPGLLSGWGFSSVTAC